MRSSSLIVASLLAALAMGGACGRTELDVLDPSVEATGGTGTPSFDAGGRRDVGSPAGSGGAAGGRGGSGAVGGIGGSSGSGGATGPVSILPQGATAPLSRVVEYRAYQPRGAVVEDITTAVTWSVDDQTVATISNASGQQGQLTTLRPGRANVRASFPPQTAVAALTVTDATIVMLSIVPPRLNVPVGGPPMFLRAVANFSNGMMSDVTQSAVWRVGDERIARVSNLPGQRGAVTGVSPGQTAVFADFAGSVANATAVVQTTPVLTSVSLSPLNPTVNVGESVQLTATGTFDNAMMQNLTFSASWTSSNPMIVQVSSGRARCLASGTVMVTASVMGRSTTTTVRCEVLNLALLRIIPADTTVPVGARIQYTCSAVFTAGPERTVTNQSDWASDRPAVATVTTTGMRGLVTATGVGMAVVTCSYGGMIAKATIAVR